MNTQKRAAHAMRNSPPLSPLSILHCITQATLHGMLVRKALLRFPNDCHCSDSCTHIHTQQQQQQQQQRRRRRYLPRKGPFFGRWVAITSFLYASTANWMISRLLQSFARAEFHFRDRYKVRDTPVTNYKYTYWKYSTYKLTQSTYVSSLRDFSGESRTK